MALVFVVDDSPLQVLAMEKMLSEEGYQVHAFRNGHDLMEQLRHQVPELIISDIEMPELDGFELLEKVRDMELSNIQKVPFFLISSRIDENTERKANQVGADLFIRKPLDRSDFPQRIREYVPYSREIG